MCLVFLGAYSGRGFPRKPWSFPDGYTALLISRLGIFQFDLRPDDKIFKSNTQPEEDQDNRRSGVIDRCAKKNDPKENDCFNDSEDCAFFHCFSIPFSMWCECFLCRLMQLELSQSANIIEAGLQDFLWLRSKVSQSRRWPVKHRIARVAC